MQLTSTQKATLKAAMLAEPAVAGFIAAGSDGQVAAYYNGDSGDVCWRSDMSAEAVVDALLDGAAEVDNLSVGKRDTLFFIAQSGRTIDATKAAVRQAFVDLTANSPQNATTVRASLTASAKRPLTRAERIFATGPTGGAYLPGPEGTLSPGEVGVILRG